MSIISAREIGTSLNCPNFVQQSTRLVTANPVMNVDQVFVQAPMLAMQTTGMESVQKARCARMGSVWINFINVLPETFKGSAHMARNAGRAFAKKRTCVLRIIQKEIALGTTRCA